MHKAWNPYNLGLLPRRRAQAKKNEGKWTKMTKMHCPLLVKRIQEPVYSIQLHVSAHSCAQCRWKQCSKTKQNQNAQWAGILGGLAHCAMSPMNFSLAASEGYAGEKIK